MPLAVSGEKADHLCAFAWRARGAGAPADEVAIVAVPRLLAGVTPAPETPGVTAPPPLGRDVWGDTRIAFGDVPAVPLENVFTRERIDAAEGGLPAATVFANFPVAVLRGAMAGQA